MSTSEDPTQGREVGEKPWPRTQPKGARSAKSRTRTSPGREVGEKPYEDPAQGREVGEKPDEDPTQGREVGEKPDEDPEERTRTQSTLSTRA